MVDKGLYLVGFILFAILQALFINGWHESFKEGMIFNPIRKVLLRKVKGVFLKPVFDCIKCESSVIGSLTFWPFAIWAFGFQWWQMPVSVCDIFVLVYLNYYFYQKI